MFKKIGHKLILMYLILAALLSTAYGSTSETDYEITKSFFALAQKNLGHAKSTMNALDNFLESFRTLSESNMNPKKKAIALHAKLNRIDHYAWNSVSHLQSFGLFGFVNRKIVESRLSLTRYQMYAKNPQIKDSIAKREYWLNKAREEIVWAGYIVYGVKKMTSIF